MSQTQETIALITGGSRGLGRSMAEHLGRAGADVITTWHARQEEADTVVRIVEAAVPLLFNATQATSRRFLPSPNA